MPNVYYTCHIYAYNESSEDMTEESNVDNVVVPKLLVDKQSDFRFHAAYQIYSQAWDKSISQETKSKLNEIINSLSEDKIDYETFYKNISQYRFEFNTEHYHAGIKTRIETTRKKDWRRNEAKSARESRHRKK